VGSTDSPLGSRWNVQQGRVDELVHQDRPGGCVNDRYFDDAPVQVGGFEELGIQWVVIVWLLQGVSGLDSGAIPAP